VKIHPVFSIIAVLAIMFAILANLEKISKKFKISLEIENLRCYLNSSLLRMRLSKLMLIEN